MSVSVDDLSPGSTSVTIALAVKCSTAAMNRSTPKQRLFSIRPLLIIGVLLTLCTSDGVGLRLLPFPLKVDAHSLIEGPAPVGSAACCKRTPSRDEYEPCRVEIVAPKFKKPSIQQGLEQGGPLALLHIDEFQPASAQETYLQTPPSLYLLVPACQSACRAPPRLS